MPPSRTAMVSGPSTQTSHPFNRYLADQVSGGEVVVAGHSDQRPAEVDGTIASTERVLPQQWALRTSRQALRWECRLETLSSFPPTG